MSEFTRRRFLGGAAAAGALAMLPTGMAQALATPRRPASMSEVKHVVVLMQENRSFDHYYGSMSGVRGFADRTTVVQPNGLDVFHQTVSGSDYLLPYHVDTFTVDGQDDGSLDHGWTSQHDAVAGGWNDDWVAAKNSEQTMAYFDQRDIPYHRALADAFTICDHYHCSLQGPTTPNRLFLFSGSIDAAGKYQGPVTGNPADYQAIYTWQSYPEFLEQVGVSWQVYANTEVGDDSGHPFVGDYGDNPLWLFKGIANDPTLKAKASVTPWQPDSGQGKDPAHVLSRFIADCQSGSLPSVSWIVAPYGYCEHPAARPLNGQIYTQTVLNALWASPELWASTALLITYDENDGLFDHVPPPLPPAGTADEFVGTDPVGLGVRVPMTVVSPWSAGGWVSSEVFDHTSVIRFTETLFHPDSPFPNISAWRRSVCGDLTSCFNFDTATTTVPSLPSMPTTAIAPGDPDDPERGLPASQPPALGSQTPPTQDSGTRPARPLPYQPMASLALSTDKQSLVTTFTNTGSAAVTLSAYRADGQQDGPWPYLVPAGGSVRDTWQIHYYGDKYKIAVHGPNRFLWQFEGDATTSSAGVEVVATYTGDSRLLLTMTNSTGADVPLTITANHYRSDGPWTYTVPANGSITGESWNLLSFDGWYDLSATVDNEPSFLRRYTGHFENGQPSVTG